ncbi:MAG: murein biosynthesis integral membrane protein MurJ [Actinomycetota bacterium]|nr:murein biosynthesis integral membrane protein MurJ [Actinomycetota bacterium]
MSVDTTLDTPASASLARGAASITIATAISRVTGFIRVMVVAATLGGTYLANTYQTANTAPNVVFELVAAGVLTSVFVPTFVDYLVRREPEEGWNAASVLTSVALVGLALLSLVIALAAPWIMRLLTIGVDNAAVREREIELGTSLLRLFAPQVIFYGVGMIMTGALHAHRRFAMPAIAPIFNNVLVIGVYLLYAAMREGRPGGVFAVTTGETLVLGLGTTLGVVAMTVCLVPQLRRLGWRFRWRFDTKHPAVGRAARVGAWTLGYAGGYQAGLIVVLVLANQIAGGVAAYQWAYVFFFVPHALFAAPIFHVLFPAMSEDVARGQTESLETRLRSATSMLLFILAPIAAGLAVAGEPLSRLTLEYGLMDQRDAELVGRVIAAFAVGLPAYSAFLVLTRAYYALGDAKTPALVNGLAVVISSVAAAVLFYAAEFEWAVPGLALGHSIGFAVGTAFLIALLRRHRINLIAGDVAGAVARSLLLGVVAALAMGFVGSLFENDSKGDALAGLSAMAATGLVVYLAGALILSAPELQRMRDLVGRKGRGG